ncbi:MAG: hypothetical protein K0S25_2218, partial [Bacillus sp. (in: firmicutes)]|nr:hypothetical protein [Bacillus sp. (in: firmicutes)]
VAFPNPAFENQEISVTIYSYITLKRK